jgi:hypothetical protein
MKFHVQTWGCQMAGPAPGAQAQRGEPGSACHAARAFAGEQMFIGIPRMETRS